MYCISSPSCHQILLGLLLDQDQSLPAMRVAYSWTGSFAVNHSDVTGLKETRRDGLITIKTSIHSTNTLFFYSGLGILLDDGDEMIRVPPQNARNPQGGGSAQSTTTIQGKIHNTPYAKWSSFLPQMAGVVQKKEKKNHIKLDAQKTLPEGDSVAIWRKSIRAASTL